MDWIIALCTGGAFASGLVLGLLCGPRRPRYLSQSEALAERLTLLRKEGSALLRQSVTHNRNGYPWQAKPCEEQSRRLFEEADRLDPPVPSGGEPGRLSLVKEKP